MAVLPLSDGTVAIVDDADYPWLSQWRWTHQPMKQSRSRHGYVVRFFSVDGRRTSISLHRVILSAGPGDVVDHINGNGLDNRRRNLRLTNATGNNRNSRKWLRGSSRYKGVRWASHAKLWRAAITVNRRAIYLGYFHDEEEAARAYDAAARERFGEFACLNFPATVSA